LCITKLEFELRGSYLHHARRSTKKARPLQSDTLNKLYACKYLHKFLLVVAIQARIFICPRVITVVIRFCVWGTNQ